MGLHRRAGPGRGRTRGRRSASWASAAISTARNLCVTCDRTRSGPHTLGRNTIVDTDLYSTACAIQNLWLAARVEGVGVGWVSILRHEDLREILGIPEHILPLAYLCVGYPREFLDEPELQRRGWAERVPLESLLYRERWG